MSGRTESGEMGSVVLRSRVSLWTGAFTGFYRPTVDEARALDAVSRFLYSARCIILVISAQAALIAGLLAATDRQFSWLAFALVLVGLVAAHMISNLSNDYFDFRRGNDTPESPRRRYTLHPMASGVLEPRIFAAGLALLAAAAFAIAAFFIVERGWTAVAFAATGTALLFMYDAAPVPLKSIGLGELAVFLVWGPLMIGGGYAMITGHIAATPLLASIPYGLGVMSILVGKHTDQMEFDARRNIHTLPVLVGEGAARAINIAIVASMYVVAFALIAFGWLSPFVGAIAIALPRAIRTLALVSRPRPAQPPEGYVGWPLWYHRACLTHNRLFGWLYILGIAAGAIWPSPM